MPTNLPQQYYKAEERFKAAREPQEKLAHLREMMAIMPHHKGTDKVRAELNKKLSALTEQIEQVKKSGKGSRPNPYFIPHGDDPMALIIGAPNSGKSSLLSKLTNANVVVAEFPFSTNLPQPGIMDYEGVHIELIDTPPLMHLPLPPWVAEQARVADVILLVADLAAPDCCEDIELIIEGLEARGIFLVASLSTDDPLRLPNERRTLLVANKADHPDAPINLEFLAEQVGPRWPRVLISCEEGEGLALFPRAVFERLEVVRVFTKVPGKPPESESPYLVPIGATVLDVAGKVHREFLDTFASARIWGSGKFDGQTVDRHHLVEDGDILEIHTK